MNNKKWKPLIIILISIALSAYLKLNTDYLVSVDLKTRMYNDLKSYKEEVENLNKKLAGVLVAGDYEVNKLLLNDEVLKSFLKSKNNASRIKDISLVFDYDDVYLRYNKVIQNALEDGVISDTEQLYISALYDYNKEIIEIFNSILNPDTNSRQNTTQKLYKNIISNYTDFSSSADEILNTQHYKILKEYRGDFTDFDIKRAEAFIKDIFSKVVPGRELNYNNIENTYADSLILSTLEDVNNIKIGKIYEQPQYKIEYDKRSKEVQLRTVGRVVPSYVLDVEKIDSIAQDIITKLNYKGVLKDKSVSNIDVPQLSNINYSYIYSKDGVLDKQRDLSIELDAYGTVTGLYIIDGDDYNKTEFADISENINYIQEKADINNIQKIRNISGEFEYIININYKGTNYNMVMDGITGKYKYTY